MISTFRKNHFAGRAAALTALLAVPPAAATSIAITTPADESPATNGNCTLREAIAAAQTNLAQDLCPAGSAVEPDVVLLLAGPHSWNHGYVFQSSVGGPIVLRGPVETPPTALVNIDPTLAERFMRLQNGADVTIENVDLRNGDVTANQSFKGGGALVAVDLVDVSLTLRNVVLLGNGANWGGGLYFETSTSETPCRLTIERSVIQGNSAAIDGAPGAPRGGGIFLQLRGQTVARIVDSEIGLNGASSTFTGNIAGGGGLYAGLSDTARLEILRTSFVGNEADAGGSANPEGAGAYLQPWGEATLRLEDARFENNLLVGPSVVGGVYVASALYVDTGFSGSFLLDRVALVGNDPGESAADLRLKHNSPVASLARNILVARGGLRGAEVSNTASAMTLAHWTVTGHAAEGLRLVQSGAPLELDNSILWNNALDLTTVGAPTVDPSNLIGVDPLFANPAGDDYRPSELSPAVDSGDGSLASTGPLDLDHGPRVAGLETDVGAYERDALFGDGFESGDTGAWD